MFRPNSLKRRLAEDRPAFGISLTIDATAVAEMLGLAGCDFVLLDAEHGLCDERMIRHCLQALSATPATGLVRLASDDRVAIKRILDFGAEAIMIPGVDDADMARAIVRACRYPPAGVRGYAASGVRASDYGQSTQRYLETYAHELVIAVMIETAEGVKNIDSIAAIEGIDVIQIGANDLSYDMGVGEQLEHPALRAAIERVEQAAVRHGRALGGALLPGESVPGMMARGYRLFTLGRDAGLLLKAASSLLNSARATTASA